VKLVVDDLWNRSETGFLLKHHEIEYSIRKTVLIMVVTIVITKVMQQSHLCN